MMNGFVLPPRVRGAALPALIVAAVLLFGVALGIGRGDHVSAATATLGFAGVGTSIDRGDSNEINGGRFVMGASAGSVSSMSVYVGPVDPAPNNQFQVAIYADKSGSPGTLVAASSSGALTANAWNTLPLSASLSASTAYWLMYNSNGTTADSNDMAYSSGGVDAWTNTSVAFGTWPGTFGKAIKGKQKFSIYATYDVLGAPTATSTSAPSATPTAGASSTASASATNTPTATPTRTPTSTSVPATPTATSTAAAQVGAWGSLFNTPEVLINGVMMPNGKVLVWGSGGNAQSVYDPATGTFTSAPINLDLLCAAQTLMADGSPFVAGGGGLSVGIANAERFSVSGNNWVNVAPMLNKRWYPTLTTLADGRIFAMSGWYSGPSDIVGPPEIYDPSQNQWTQLTNASNVMPTYPFMYLLSDGRLLHAGGSEVPTDTEALDLGTQQWTTVQSTLVDGGSSVMYLPDKIMKAGSAADSGSSGPAAAAAYTLDMTAASPQWTPTGSMAYPRAFLNLTVLPDGSVLSTGGETTKDGTNLNNAVLPAEIWNPATGTWTTVAPMNQARLYHSIAVLLPDGRVLVGGTGGDAPSGVPEERTAQIYSPPYLFKGARPTIASVPSAPIPYGSSFFVGTPNGSSIASVALVAPSAVTHSTNMNQRYVPLSFSQTSGGLNVQMPSNANVAPAGSYMLFIVDSNGVPSVAARVSLPASGVPATPTPTATATPGGPTSTPTPSATPGGTSTLGSTAIGSQTDSGDANEINGTRFTMGQFGGTATSMSVYVGSVSAAPANQYQLAIYADNNGTPSTLVASSASGTLTANAWNTLPISASLSANTTYWLVYNTNGPPLNNMKFNAGGSAAWTGSAVSFGSWPATFPSPVFGSQTFSIYVTYTVP